MTDARDILMADEPPPGNPWRTVLRCLPHLTLEQVAALRGPVGHAEQLRRLGVTPRADVGTQAVRKVS